MAGRSAAPHVAPLIERLNTKYPGARYELNYETPFQLLVATILAAQATDERINRVTPALFAKYPGAKAFAEADRAELEKDLKPTGFYRNKAKAVQECARALVERFGGEVPPRMEDLVTLPGVARKTANVVLNNAFRIPSGIIVDTHVQRVSQRLGLSAQTRPEKIEQDLMRLVPQEEWVQFGPALVLHGRYTCTAHKPKCGACLFEDLCPKIGVEEADEGGEAPANEEAGAERQAGSVPSLAGQLPPDWRDVLADEFAKPYFRSLQEFVAAERGEFAVFPPDEDVFNAFRFTPFEEVKVLLLGQDPYHDDGQAHGLCFSVRHGMKPPPSLVNIFKELRDDLGIPAPAHGYLESWAKQGVMLLNAVLTVRAHEPASHKERGWETFTDAVIRALSARARPVVFLLWGAYAHKKEELIDASRHVVLKAAHPSPLSAKKFFGGKPFSQTNQALGRLGLTPVDWRISGENEAETKAMPAEPEPAKTAAPPAEPEPAHPAAGVPRTALTSLHSPRHAALLPEDWRHALADEFDKAYFHKLEKYIDAERQEHAVYPAEDAVFRAFALTPFASVKVVLLGGEPSAKKGQSDGLAFSVPPGVAPTPALKNLFQELRADLGHRVPRTGCLEPWAKRGVLLLNVVLTARAGEPGSHAGRGWETFTDAVVRALGARDKPLAFLLCGEAGARKEKLVAGGRHAVRTLPEPASREFLGTRPFSAANDALEKRGLSAVSWRVYVP